MKVSNSKLIIIRQLDNKLKAFTNIINIKPSPKGWINQIRTSLNMSRNQLGNILNMTQQGLADLEKREAEETITLKSLREAGEALNLKLVYGFVSKDGSLEATIEKKAREQAARVISRTSTTMRLEDQENSNERLQEALNEMTMDIKKELPKSLWD